MSESSKIRKFVSDQLSVWPMAAANFRSLKNAETRKLTVGGLEVTLQHNPERIRSSAAKVDSASIKARSCFLCESNRPEEQRVLKFEGRKGRKYDICINPYPIFPNHLTIIRDRHVDQSIWHRLTDMADLAHHYTDFTVFYNGPRCGASAPDHMHFQACPRGIMPLETEVDRLIDRIATADSVPNGEEAGLVPDEFHSDIEYITSVQEAQLFHYKHFTRGAFVLRARTSKSLAKLFYRLLDCAPIPEGEKEPMFNLLMWYKSRKGGVRPAGNTHGISGFEYRAIVLFRGSHRSHHYFDEGPDHLTMSPGCADMAGLFIVPKKEDYDKLDVRLLTEMMQEVSVSEEVEKEILWRLTRTQRKLEVGIMSAPEIVFEIVSDGAGPQKVGYMEGKISYNGALYDELYFEARTISTMFAEPSFILHDVTIGVDFHWQRKQTQCFAGALKFIVEGGKVVAVNIIGVEDYLLSVISSEMKSTSDLNLLKAHAVISRSWVTSMIGRRKINRRSEGLKLEELNNVPSLVTHLESREEKRDSGDMVKWFDHEDHKHFDVCADDHCQRYQGLTMAVGENVRKAIDATWGQVLTYDGKICDARFHKCCGGRTELFSTCWEDKDLPYLQSLPDTPGHEEGADPFCNTADAAVLSQVLNDYDLETKDFFSWKAEYSRAEISELISRRSGRMIGELKELKPLETGPSGRIKKLEVVGTAGSFVVGKELMVRKILSESHLKSSAFSIVWTKDDRLVLEGHGWGHGVGLCQIGAAVMASRGYGYDEILQHYYPGTSLERL
ncbi:MAG: DUF4922 domain-containing protein [Bacteroidales bacterium]|nr:DUF4922 domain-containing protein [Bacteroidales bacterium]